MSKTVNYESLQSPVTLGDVKTYVIQAGNGKFQLAGLEFVFFVLILMATSAVIYFIINTSQGRAIEIPIDLFAVFAFFGVALVAACYGLFAGARCKVRIKRFAEANGFTFLRDISNPDYTGLIFHDGDTRKLQVGFATKGLEVGEYSFMVGSGKNRHQVDYGYIRIDLLRHLPHMVLDAKSNNLFGKLTNLPESFNRSQRLQLEGDFNNYFDLYVPKQYERDALYVMTPNIMVALIDEAKAYDLEIIDNQLFIYSANPFRLYEQTELEKLFALTGVIGKELNEQVDYYADERIGNRSTDIVAAPGQRLKKGVNWTVFAIIFFTILYFALQFYGVNNRYGP